MSRLQYRTLVASKQRIGVPILRLYHPKNRAGDLNNLIEFLDITTSPLPLMERGDDESKYDGTEAYCQTYGNDSKRPRNVCDLSRASDAV